MMLKHTFRASLLSLILGAGVLSADSTAHTFNDGAQFHYTIVEGSAEPSNTPIVISEATLSLPYLGDAILKGKGELSKDATTGQYTLTLNPKIDLGAQLGNTAPIKMWDLIKAGEKGLLTLKLSDLGESIKASNFIIEQGVSRLSGESFDYSHEFKKVDGAEELYSNKTKLVIANGNSITKNEELTETELEALVQNPFTKFKELLINFSYISGKDYGDFKKDFAANYHIKGHKDFVLDGAASSGFPFEKTAGAEKLQGYTFSLSMPVIDFRVDTEEEKQGVMEALKHNIKAYQKIFSEYNNPFTDAILTSIKKNQEELLDRSYKYFTSFTKEDTGSFFLTMKTAKNETDSPEDRALAELDLLVRHFKMKVFFTGTEESKKFVITMDEPEVSIKELTKFVLTNATLIEPILKDLGYWDLVQNLANAEKILNLLRQLSDDPKATGNAPLVITYAVDPNGAKVGTLSDDMASQLLLGWVLSIVPIK